MENVCLTKVSVFVKVSSWIFLLFQFGESYGSGAWKTVFLVHKRVQTDVSYVNRAVCYVLCLDISKCRAKKRVLIVDTNFSGFVFFFLRFFNFSLQIKILLRCCLILDKNDSNDIKNCWKTQSKITSMVG